MGAFKNVPIDETNQEQRTPCLLLLDTSGSMADKKIAALNAGLKIFESDLKKNEKAALRCEVAIIEFGGIPSQALVIQDFLTVDRFRAPTLSAAGTTPLGGAIDLGLSLLRDRKERYRQAGLNYTRPWFFILTDGEPTDEWKPAAQQLVEEEARKGLIVYPIGVEGAKLEMLKELSRERPPLMLRGIQFGELFQWLSRSQQRASAAKPGETCELAPITWARVTL